VNPNTHCSGIGKSMGLQWVLSDATLARKSHKRVYRGS